MRYDLRGLSRENYGRSNHRIESERRHEMHRRGRGRRLRAPGKSGRAVERNHSSECIRA